MTLEGGEYGLQTPWSDRGVGINVGGEYRKESLNFDTDVEFQTGDLAGQGGPTSRTTARSTFASCSPKSRCRSSATPSSRSSRSPAAIVTPITRSNGGNSFTTDTYKLSAELAPIRDIRFRASYNRAVRAPNIVELFFPQGLGLSVGSDPVRRARRPFFVAQCANTGMPAAQYGTFRCNPANQYNALFGGNANLTPEKADTYTFGVVLQPRWVPGLAFTVDYFNIKVKNLIAPLPFNGVLASCAVTG